MTTPVTPPPLPACRTGPSISLSLGQLRYLLRPCQVLVKRCKVKIPGQSAIINTEATGTRGDDSRDSSLLSGSSSGEIKDRYTCIFCGQIFKVRGTLNAHIRRHIKEHRVLCLICSKILSRSSLKLHVANVHERLKPFNCKLCGKAFGKNGNLQQHIRTHTQEKPYKCSSCGVSFSQLGNLQRHQLRNVCRK